MTFIPHWSPQTPIQTEGPTTDEDEGNTTCSEQPLYQSGHDTDRSRRTNTSNRSKRRNRKKHKEDRERRPTNAKKEENKRNGKVVLSLFRDSPKEGALTYTDWHREVEEYLRKGYDNDRIKDAMLSSVEGQAYVNFHSCDEGRNCTPAQILQEMDGIYDVSITFRDLNARMCGLKQGSHEPIKAYYERMADVSVKLEQYHGDRFGPGELSLMKKDEQIPRLTHEGSSSIWPSTNVEGNMGTGGFPVSCQHDTKTPWE